MGHLCAEAGPPGYRICSLGRRALARLGAFGRDGELMASYPPQECPRAPGTAHEKRELRKRAFQARFRRHSPGFRAPHVPRRRYLVSERPPPAHVEEYALVNRRRRSCTAFRARSSWSTRRSAGYSSRGPRICPRSRSAARRRCTPRRRTSSRRGTRCRRRRSAGCCGPCPRRRRRSSAAPGCRRRLHRRRRGLPRTRCRSPRSRGCSIACPCRTPRTASDRRRRRRPRPRTRCCRCRRSRTLRS